MSRPRHLGSSPSLTRSLSRLSSSSSFQVRQSNSRIYTFLVAGALVLFATVALLQVHLLRAPQGSKLSPLENGKPDEGVGAEQAWWKENAGEGNTRDPVTGKGRGFAKSSKLGRKMGAVQTDGDGDEGESSDEEMDTGDEIGDDEDEDVEQDLFDIDIDDRLLEEEAEDLEAVDLKILAEMSNEDDSADIKETAKSEQTVENQGVSGVASVTKNAKPVKHHESNDEDVSTDTATKETAKPEQTATVAENQGVERVASVAKNAKPAKHHESKQGNAIPDWVLDKKLQEGAANTLEKGFEKVLVKDVENKKGSFFWDHALGIRKRSALENVELAGESDDKVKSVDMKRLAAGDEDAATVALVQLRGFKEVVQNWKERFNSDDELVDDDVEERLEGVHEIEDALLLNGDGSHDKAAHSKKLGGFLKKGRGVFDAMHPANNPMLQDPDTDAGTWMTKTDKEMLRAIRGDRSSGGQQQPKALLRGNILNDGTVTNPVVSSREASAVDGKQKKAKISDQNAEISDQDGSSKTNSASLESTSQSKEGEQQWGYYPGIGSSLSFSELMEAFLGQESCSMNVFMVWSTPAWGFTARHQRVLESLFRLHRNACVAVFSETFELGFFNSFVKDGYKVTVVRPNLQELLADTPSDVFAAVLPKWKEKPLFHLHYSELLRLTALYKFGGVYLDMDMLVLRPLDSLRNTVGSEITDSGDLRLNGAVLAFDKSSLFLKKCMEEFTRTYDETLVHYNGADLLTRVANSTVDDKGSTWTQFPGLLKIEGPFTFFPLDSSGISKFFAAPRDDMQKQQQGLLLSRISGEAYTIHLWNSLTSNLVPEVNSLVGIILSRSCLRCKDVL